MTLELENTRRDLIAMRVRYGADTPIGHRCSNIVKQLENLQNASGDQRYALQAAINKQMIELEKLAAERRFILSGGLCVTCSQYTPGDGIMPPHDASARCESGKRNHCSCDICF